MTPATLNTLANLPSIRDKVAPGHRDIDLTTFFDHPDNVALGDQDGVVLFGHHGAGVYEMHYLMGPDVRGRAALTRLRAALKTMFTEHGATAIVGDTPDAFLSARVINRALGGVPTARTTDDLGRPCTTYKLERQTWACC